MTALGITQLLVALAHGARIAVRDDDQARRAIAAAACILYSVVAMGCLYEDRWALWVGAVGPALGLAAVLLSGSTPDRWQLAVGVVQVAATAGSVGLLVAG